MELAARKTPYGAIENQSWLDNLEGLKRPYPVTIDGSLFSSGSFPDGVIPSGTVIAKKTSTGLYGPYNHANSDGTQTAVGLLINTALCGAGRAGLGAGIDSVTLLTVGDVLQNKLPSLAAADGALDSYAITALAQVRFRNV
jgi:hypothetical protein